MSNRRRHEGTRDAPEPSKCLGVFGLSLYTSERELEAEFKRFGPLEKVQVVLDGHTGRSRGFAFIYFENTEDATEARNAMTGAEMDGRKIRVDFSITKRAHTPTPGMYMGRPTTGGRSVLFFTFFRNDKIHVYHVFYSDKWNFDSLACSNSSLSRYGGGGRDRRDRRRSPSPHYRGRRSPSPYYRRRYGEFMSI